MSLTQHDVQQSVIRTRRFGKKALAYAAAAAVVTTTTAAQADFTGPYDPANWTTTTVNGNPDQSVSNDGSVAIITGTDAGSGDAISYSVTVAANGPFEFDWSYTNLGGDYGSFDYAGFVVDGDFVLLADNDDALGGPATGSSSLKLSAGQSFSFAVASLDGTLGAGELTISNFNAASAIPEPSSLGLLAAGTIGGLLAGRRRRK